MALKIGRMPGKYGNSRRNPAGIPVQGLFCGRHLARVLLPAEMPNFLMEQSLGLAGKRGKVQVVKRSGIHTTDTDRAMREICMAGVLVLFLQPDS